MGNNIISVGIFFDGTGNNGINATASRKPPASHESYYGNTTNIYKLFRLFEGDEKLYVEGIGTVTGYEDNDFSMATCTNSRGTYGYSSDEKLQKAFSFMEALTHDSGKQYQLYVYGFNRGAMLARNFCYELQKQGAAVQVKFLGLFDTVESAAFNEYAVSVLPATENVLHLCAGHETRYFFPLTGIFEESKDMQDTKYEAGAAVWKEIFVPGAHADVGGGYLEASQSVYVSPKMINDTELCEYIANITDEKYSLWSHLLEDCMIDSGDVFSKAYVARDLVYADLSKVYGRLMLTESNRVNAVFSTRFDESDFLFSTEKHPYLEILYHELENYAQDLLPALRPVYDYGKLAGYTHLSANFGLYYPELLLDSKSGALAELINNGLNVPTRTDERVRKSRLKRQSEIHHIENSKVDYAYGTNIPNNDHWNRTIIIKEKLYNKC